MSSPTVKPSTWQRVGLMTRVTWKCALRRSRITHVFAYVFLALLLIPVIALVGGTAFEAADEATSMQLEHLFFFVFAAFLFLKGLLAGTVHLETHKFFVYPVSHRTILLASALGRILSPSTLIFVALLVGIVVETPSPFHLCAATAAVAAFTGFVSATSLLVQMLTANLLRSRLLRDTSSILGSLLIVGVYLSIYLLPRAPIAHEVNSVIEALRPCLAYVPSTWAAEAAHPATAGIRVLALLTGIVASTALIAMAANRLQQMAFYGEIAFTAPRAASRLGLLWRGRWFSRSVVWTMLVKEIHTLRRDPLVKDLLIRQLGIVLVPVVALFFSSDSPRHPAVLLFLVLYMLLLGETLLFFNLFGLDDRGITVLLTTSAPRWKILAGKNAALLAIFVPLNVGVSSGMLLLLDAPHYLGFAAGLGTAGVASVLSVGNFASCYFPQRLLTRQKSALAPHEPEQRGFFEWVPRVCLTAVAVLLSVPVGLLLGLPLAASGPGSYLWTLPITALYAGLLLGVSIPSSARALESREEALLSTFAWRK